MPHSLWNSRATKVIMYMFVQNCCKLFGLLQVAIVGSSFPTEVYSPSLLAFNFRYSWLKRKVRYLNDVQRIGMNLFDDRRIFALSNKCIANFRFIGEFKLVLFGIFESISASVSRLLWTPLWAKLAHGKWSVNGVKCFAIHSHSSIAAS